MIAWSAVSLFSLIAVVYGQANCPPGQAPFMPNIVPVACNQATPNACGSTIAFCQSVPSNAPQFVTLCCRNLPASCPNSQVPSLLPPTSSPVPCTFGQANNCPAGATCTSMPSNPVGVQTLCCTKLKFDSLPNGTLSLARCSNTAERPLFEAGTARYRNCLVKACPSTHRCEYDFVNRVNACCGPPATASATDCPVNNVLMFPQTGTPVTCGTGSIAQCPTSNRYCMYSASFGHNVCCSSTTASPSDCGNSDVLLSRGTVATCSRLGVGQCPSTFAYCTYSASRRQNVCCRRNIGK